MSGEGMKDDGSTVVGDAEHGITAIMHAAITSGNVFMANFNISANNSMLCKDDVIIITDFHVGYTLCPK